jgi:hypothetical protein
VGCPIGQRYFDGKPVVAGVELDEFGVDVDVDGDVDGDGAEQANVF